ncbi:MAG: NADH-quinone oxidoreductase subunit NuoE [Deltaproteobacteria bacterium]
METKAIDLDRVRAILNKHQGEKWALIPVLQEIQEAIGYVPPETIEVVAETLHVFPSQVQGVVTFYAGFSLEPKGKNVVKVCRGTACHVRGGRSILRFVKRELSLEEGGTSPDYRFSLETVACLGACFLAPTMMVNKAYYGKLSPPKVSSILNQYGKNEEG